MDADDSLMEFTAYHRRMLGLSLAVAVAVTVGLAVVKQDDMAWAAGFAIGSVAQLFKFGFVDISVVRRIAVEKRDAASTQLKALFVSLLIFGLAVVCVSLMRLNVWAMAAGIFLPRLILVADTYIRPNPFRKDAAPENDGEN